MQDQGRDLGRNPAHVCIDYFTLREYDDAIKALLEGVASNPSSERLHVWLAASYAKAGLIDGASWEAEQVLTINPSFPVLAASAAYLFEQACDRENFLEGLNGLEDRLTLCTPLTPRRWTLPLGVHRRGARDGLADRLRYGGFVVLTFRFTPPAVRTPRALRREERQG